MVMTDEAEKDDQVDNPVSQQCCNDDGNDQTHSLRDLPHPPQTAQLGISQPLQPPTSALDPTSPRRKILGIAPMLDVTTREFRQLMRILSKEMTIWTEMVVDATIIHADDLDNHLGMDESLNQSGCTRNDYNSHPIVCQIGGNCPERIYNAVQKIMQHYDYDEININMGCPSQLVAGKNMFGAVLMKHRDVAKAAVEAMQNAVQDFETEGEAEIRKKKEMRLSVKCRIGVDDWDSFELLREFIQVLSPFIQIFYIHARKALLGGKFTTKQNRAIPPLNYPWVYALCDEFPNCEFHINGGIPDLKTAKQLCYGQQMTAERSQLAAHDGPVGEEEKKSDNDPVVNAIDQAKELDLHYKKTTSSQSEQNQHHPHHKVPCSICKFPNGSCVAPPMIAPSNLRGCMLGRAARDNPCLFWDVDRYLYGKPVNPCQNRWEVLAKYLEYIEQIVPPRCCDSNARDTRTLPMPFEVQRDYDACPLCASYGPSSMWKPEDNMKESGPGVRSVAPLDYDCGSTKPKISSHVFSRVLRPLIGVLNGVPSARKFRQEFDRLLKQEAPHKGGAKKLTSSDAPLPCYRNCGPAVVIRMALLHVMDRQVLMQNFQKTEEISIDYSRSIDCLKGKRTW